MQTRAHWLPRSLALLATWFAVPVLGAQSAPTLTPDARVRVWAPPRAWGHEGTLVALDTGAVGALVWRRPVRVARGRTSTRTQITDTIPLAAVQQLDVRVRRRSGPRTVGFGVLGVVIGVPVGALAGDALQGECYELGCLPAMLGGAAVGGVAGWVGGRVVGARPVDRWERVTPPRRVGLIPLRRGLAVTIGP